MKATGIIRRIDELGRIVIPKEIRRNMNIREGDALEIYTSDINGRPVFCFRKYEMSLIPEIAAFADMIDDDLMGKCYDRRNEIRDHFNAIANIIKEMEES